MKAYRFNSPMSTTRRLRTLGLYAGCAMSVLRELSPSRSLAVTGTALAIVAGCSCTAPESVPITPRHSLFFASSTLVCVIETATRDVVIDGEVQELGVAGDVVAGRAKHFDSTAQFYFVLHSNTGQVVVLDTMSEMEACVGKAGVERVQLRGVAEWR